MNNNQQNSTSRWLLFLLVAYVAWFIASNVLFLSLSWTVLFAAGYVTILSWVSLRSFKPGVHLLILWISGLLISGIVTIIFASIPSLISYEFWELLSLYFNLVPAAFALIFLLQLQASETG